MPLLARAPYALGGVAVGGLSRGGDISPLIFITIGGVHYGNGRADEDTRVLLGTLEVTDALNHEPNTARFTCAGFTPSAGQEVIITRGSKNNPDREFAGLILNVGHAAWDNPAHGRFHVSAVDYTWGLDKRLVIGHYNGTPAAIVRTLIAEYAPDYTTVAVSDDLGATLEGGITFTNEALSQALSRIAARSGASWYVDYHKDVHFFLEETQFTNPVTLSLVHNTLHDVVLDLDISQVVTRVYSEGDGTTALETVDAGAISVPVISTDRFSVAGGIVASGPQRISYGGIVVGGPGALIGPGASPSTAPTATLSSGSGVDTGTHEYAVTYQTASGESVPGPRVSATTGTTAAPASGPTTAVSAGGGVDGGIHYYAVTFVTSAGETTIGPNTLATTENAATDPSSFPTVNNVTGNSYGTDTGLTPGALYKWKYTYVRTTDGAETLPSSSFAQYTPANASSDRYDIYLPDMPSPPAGYTRRFYRTTGGGSIYKRVLGGFFFGNYFQDGSGDAQLGADAPSSNGTALKTVTVSNVPIGPAGVTGRKVYRTTAGGSTYKLVGTFTNNTQTSFVDTTSDAGLGADAPGANTAISNQIALTNIPVGVAAVTGRRIYRTAVGSAQLKLLTTIADNTTTTYTDSTADSGLGTNAPTVDASGLPQPAGIVVAGSTSVPVAGTSWASSGGGWAIIGNGEQIIRYGGTTSTALTGVPSTGVGSLSASVAYNANISSVAALVGIPASGAGSIQSTIVKGDQLQLVVQVDDVTAQAALAARIGGDGVQEAYLQDRRLRDSEARARAEALLDLRSNIDVRMRFRSRDVNTRSGRSMAVDLGSPWNITQTLRIQQVVSTYEFETAQPLRTVDASSSLLSFQDLLRSASE